MKKEKSQKVLLSGIAMVVLFILWTVAISLIDVQPIGPQNSSVGFATLNGFIHSLTGVHMAIYTVTDWLGLIPLCFILGFALLGLIQLIKRKSLFKVDSSILVLGAFYIVVMAAYLFFEFYVVNYRPVLINGFLEASYPSSTTLLVMCVMPTAVMQLNSRIRNTKMKRALPILLRQRLILSTPMQTDSLLHRRNWNTARDILLLRFRLLTDMCLTAHRCTLMWQRNILPMRVVLP